MHLHSMWSGDATTTPDELAGAIAETGVDVLCLTDHNTVNGALELAATGQLGCRVVVGEELRTGSGEIIGLFLTERLPYGLAAPDAVARIRDQGGLVYIPHPFDPVRHCLAEEVLYGLARDGGIDAVEVFNAKTSLQSLNRRAAEFASEFGLPGGAGSDAHEPSAIGAAFAEMPDRQTGLPTARAASDIMAPLTKPTKYAAQMPFRELSHIRRSASPRSA